MDKIIILVVLFISVVFSQNYHQEIKEWDEKRIESLKKNWISLIDLYWLSDGENTIGSDTESDLVLPKHFPQKLGIFLVKKGVVQFVAHVPKVYAEEEEITTSEVFSTGKSKTLTYKSLTWFVIDRSGNLGIRIRDSKSEEIKKFKGIERFDVDSKWKIEADFVAYSPPKMIQVTSILGMVEESKCPGKLVFSINKKDYQLDAVESGESFFIMFKDTTNEHQTYVVGRYMSAQKPDKNNKVILDFNKAYNPPCGYTYYATCPLVPKQNHLDIDITAGEKYTEHH